MEAVKAFNNEVCVEPVGKNPEQFAYLLSDSDFQKLVSLR